MAKEVRIICDRRKVGLHAGNWLVDAELCNECALIVEMAAEYTARDVSQDLPLGTTARKVLEMYESKEL